MGNNVELISNLCSYAEEREWFEFKENWFEKTELGEYISALSNVAAALGKEFAYFIWGVNDETHEITGTAFNPNCSVKGEPLQHYLERNLSPKILFLFEEETVRGKRVVVLKIAAAKTTPTAFLGVRYFRVGSSKVDLMRHPEREAFLFSVLRNGLPTITNTKSDYQDLTFEKLFVYYASKGVILNKKTFKKNLELLTKDGEYNILAQLLADDSHLPLRVSIFSGKTKAAKLYSVREFGYQNILYSLEEVLRYGSVLNIIQADESNRVVERTDVPLFDDEAFREAVINAFVHNKWVTGNEPMISVYSDRIEILSRGTIPPNQTIKGFFLGESVPVNEKLSEIFLQLHISEKSGRGVPKIIEKYGRSAFEFRENTIVVTIPFNRIGDKNEKLAVSDADSSRVKLNLTQTRVLTEIRNNPNITKTALAQLTGYSKSTVDNVIASLKKNGVIERIGSNKSGYWKIIK